MQTVEQLVGKDALEEWLESPVTAWFAEAILARADIAVQSRANTFYSGEPNKTQEWISYFNGAVEELNALYGALNENWIEGDECPLNVLMPEFEDE